MQCNCSSFKITQLTYIRQQMYLVERLCRIAWRCKFHRYLQFHCQYIRIFTLFSMDLLLYWFHEWLQIDIWVSPNQFFSGGQAPQTPKGSIATLAPRPPNFYFILVKLCAHDGNLFLEATRGRSNGTFHLFDRDKILFLLLHTVIYIINYYK